MWAEFCKNEYAGGLFRAVKTADTLWVTFRKDRPPKLKKIEIFQNFFFLLQLYDGEIVSDGWYSS